jgi:lipid-A-disaccharide synthase
MWAAARLVEQRYTAASFIVAAPSPQVAAIVRAQIARLPGGPTRWDVVAGNTRQVLRQARAAMVASGTATVETALMRCPMVITYRMAALSFFLAKRLVKTEHIGMVNIIAGRRLCPELVQGEATPAALAEAIAPLLRDGPEREEILRGLATVTEALGEGNAAERAADAVAKELSGLF